MTTDGNLWRPGEKVMVREPGQRHLAFSPATVVHANHPYYLVRVLAADRDISVKFPDIESVVRDE
jgi:hypothetical protein